MFIMVKKNSQQNANCGLSGVGVACIDSICTPQPPKYEYEVQTEVVSGVFINDSTPCIHQNIRENSSLYNESYKGSVNRTEMLWDHMHYDVELKYRRKASIPFIFFLSLGQQYEDMLTENMLWCIFSPQSQIPQSILQNKIISLFCQFAELILRIRTFGRTDNSLSFKLQEAENMNRLCICRHEF